MAGKVNRKMVPTKSVLALNCGSIEREKKASKKDVEFEGGRGRVGGGRNGGITRQMLNW